MFIEQFKQILKQERVNISELARVAGKPRSDVYTVLNRGRDPNPVTMERLVAALSEVTGKQYEIELTISEKQSGAYSETEINCPGCYGPCGRCEELNKKLPETAKN